MLLDPAWDVDKLHCCTKTFHAIFRAVSASNLVIRREVDVELVRTVLGTLSNGVLLERVHQFLNLTEC